MARPLPPAATHNRLTVWDLLCGLLVMAGAFLLLFCLRPAPSAALEARILVDGHELARYELDKLERPVLLPLEDLSYPLTVELASDGIRVSESACPGNDCLRGGWARQSGEQIICLPNRLVISLTGRAGGLPAIDGVTG